MAVRMTLDKAELEIHLKDIRGMGARGKRISLEEIKKMASQLKEQVAIRMEPTWNSGAGHNTPVSIRRFLHYGKSGDSYRVFFDPYPVQGGGDLIQFVEGGTKRHPQPNNPIIRDGKGGAPHIHHGAKGKHMVRDAFNNFKSVGLDVGVSKIAERIVKDK